MKRKTPWFPVLLILSTLLVASWITIVPEELIIGEFSVMIDICPDVSCMKKVSGWGVSDGSGDTALRDALMDAVKSCENDLLSKSVQCQWEISQTECPQSDILGNIICYPSNIIPNIGQCTSGQCHEITAEGTTSYAVTAGTPLEPHPKLVQPGVFKPRSSKIKVGSNFRPMTICTIPSSVKIIKICSEESLFSGAKVTDIV